MSNELSGANKITDDNGKKRICYVTTIFQSMDWFIVDAARHLHRNGYQITMICNMSTNFIARNSDFARCVHIPMDRGISVISSLKAIWAMYHLFRSEKFDIIQYSTPNAALCASVASWLARCPIRLYAQWGLRYEGFRGMKRFVFLSLEWLTCRLSSHIRAQSPKNRLLGIQSHLYSPNKVRVVGLGGTIGVSLKDYDLSCKTAYRTEIRTQYGINDQFVFGYVGRINADKGINELTEAFRHIINMGGTQYLLLVGMVDDVNPISPENMEWLKSCPKVIMTGNIPLSDIPKYMSVVDILVHPTYREGFGKVLQEAMAMQLPIITTDVPGPSEVIEDGRSGLLVPIRDPDALSREMLRLYADKPLAIDLATAARARVEMYFARDKMVANILTDMDQIIPK